MVGKAFDKNLKEDNENEGEYEAGYERDPRIDNHNLFNDVTKFVDDWISKFNQAEVYEQNNNLHIIISYFPMIYFQKYHQ